MKAKQIIDIMEKHYPLSLQEEWDKCGLQIGNINQNIHKIMISLNADLYSLTEAIEQGCDMLITHHPFLLDPIENIDKDHFMGAFIYKAIENHVVVYSSHTALDRVSMNEWLIRELDVKDVSIGKDGITRLATLNKPYPKDEFIQHVKNAYHLEHLKYAGHKDFIEKIGLCGGSGADFMFDYEVDAFITGDTKYRNAKNAVDYHILLVDINHHAENIMVHKLKELLEKEIDVEILEGTSLDYYTYL